MLYTEIPSDILIHSKLTHKQNEWINKQKHYERTFQLKKWMLSRWWSKPKWIKHIAAQVGSAHPSGWNVTLNLQLKRSFFFNQSGTFPSKVFWNRLDPNVTIKRSTKVQKSQSTPRLRVRGSSSVAFRTRTKNSDALLIKLVFQHYTETRRVIAYRPTSHTVPQYQTSHSRTTYTRSPSDPLSGGRRLVSFLTYQLLFI